MKHISLLLFVALNCFCINSIAQAYKVGEKVIAKDDVNNWLPAQIIDIKGDQYKIHFDTYGDWKDMWVPLTSLKAKENKTATDDKTKSPKLPAMNGALPKIVGTAWWLQAIYKKGKQPKNNFSWPPMIFCKNGRWELQNNYFQSGTYKVQGNRLYTVGSGADKLKETYVITWNSTGKYMELTASDNTVLRLVYNTVSACGSNDK